MDAKNKKDKALNDFLFGVVGSEGARSYPSLESLGKKYQIPRATIFRWAKKERWQDKKNQQQSKIQERLEDARVSDLVKEAHRLDKNSLQIAQAMIHQVGKKLEKVMRKESLQQRDSVKASELKDMATTVLTAQRVGKLALGEAQEISKVSADVRQTSDTFREIMEQLDEVAESKLSSSGESIQ